MGDAFSRYWVVAKGWEIGRVVAWGVDQGIRLSIAERQHRLWMLYMPFQAFVFVIPLATAAATLAIAGEVVGTNAKNLLYLLAFLEVLAALGALVLGTYWTARLVVSVRAGKLGYLGGEDPADAFGAPTSQ